jgi:hypothetical protein
MKPVLLFISLALFSCIKTPNIPAVSASSTPTKPPAKLIVPELEKYDAPNAMMLPGEIYPIGWSKDGAFAYVYEAPDEACGCYFFHLVIQDMILDKILWEYDYNSGKSEDNQSEKIEDLAEMWQAHGKEFEAKLAFFGVVRGESTLIPLPQNGPEPLSAVFSTTSVPEEKSEYGFGYLSSYELQMSSSLGKKTILKSGELSFGLLDVSSQSYIKSPFEPRIAVLVQETWRGWEGIPHRIELRFSGCDLIRGW